MSLCSSRIASVMPEGNKSLVDLEYDKACESAKLTFCFLLNDDQPWPPSQIDADYARIHAFRNRLLKQNLITFFTTPDDLAAKVALAVSQYSMSRGAPRTPPSLATQEKPATSIDDVLNELKAMRLEFSALHQSVGDVLRRSTAVTSHTGERPDSSSADFLGPLLLSTPGAVS